MRVDSPMLVHHKHHACACWLSNWLSACTLLRFLRTVRWIYDCKYATKVHTVYSILMYECYAGFALCLLAIEDRLLLLLCCYYLLYQLGTGGCTQKAEPPSPPPPPPSQRSGKTHVLNSQIKRHVANLLMYISLIFHFRYILTEVAITMKPFKARTAKFEDVQVEVLKLQSKPWSTELACYNY